MRIPNASSGIIDRAKIVDYLLDENHADGGPKARLLASLGYARQKWQVLASDIRQIHLDADVDVMRATSWGTRYEVEAPLTGPTGDTVLFRSIWQIDIGSDIPRLITMYPE
jgi:hypothetical protein